MIRTAVLILLFVAACDKPDPQPLIVRISNEPEGVRVLDTGESTLRTGSIQWRVTVYSETDRLVTVKMRLGKGAPKSMRARLVGVEPIRPADSEVMQLVIAPPRELGPFEADVILYADELPDWEYVLTIKGSRVDKPIAGKYIEIKPAGIEFGAVRPGEKREFKFDVVTFGDQPVEITEVRPRDPKAVQIYRSRTGFTLRPGERRTVEGVALIAGQGKSFHSQIEVRSDARNARVLIVTLSGRIRSDYDVSPARFPVRSIYKALAKDFTIRIDAAKDVEPFAVESVAGLEPLFELAKPLAKKPASSQTITVRLRPDAPAGSDLMQGELRFSLAPKKVQLKWPYALRVLPPVNANPPEIKFGTVDRSKLDRAVERRIQVLALPGRKFKVTGAKSQRGYFHVRIPEHVAGMAWEIVVSLPALSDKGVYRDQILVETDDPEVPRLLVPVRAVVR